MPLTRHQFVLGLACASVLPLWGCSVLTPADPNAPVITGTAAYRARATLTAAAVFEATLEEASVDGAPPKLIGSVRMGRLDPPPFRFQIPYDPAQIVPGRRYTVNARIWIDEQLRFVTDTGTPVLGPDNVKHVKLQLSGEGGGPRPTPGT